MSSFRVPDTPPYIGRRRAGIRPHLAARTPGGTDDLYERAQLLKPDDSSIAVALASLDRDVGLRAGQRERALTLLDSLTTQLQPAQDAVVPMGRMAVFEALDRPDDLEAAVAEGRAMLERTGVRALENLVLFYGGRVHEMRGDWQAAIEAYTRQRENDPTDYSVPSRLGRCYRKLGQLDRAEDLILQTLKLKPSNGRAHYDLALVYQRMGRKDDAVSHLRQALNTWAAADDGFPWAQRARAKLAELTAS